MKNLLTLLICFSLSNCKDVETQAKPRTIYTLKVVYLDGKSDTIISKGIDYEIKNYNDHAFSVPPVNYLEVSGRKVAKNVRSVSLLKSETINSSK